MTMPGRKSSATAVLAAMAAVVAAASGIAVFGRTGAPPEAKTQVTSLALAADQQSARIITPAEALGTVAKAAAFTQPGTEAPQEDPRVIPACHSGRAVAHLSASAGPITRRYYYTSLPGHPDFWAHSFRITVATYPAPRAAQDDAARLAHPPRCRARETVPFHRWQGRSYEPAHREERRPQAAGGIDGWSHQRVIARAAYPPSVEGGTENQIWVVHDIATKDRELLDTQYMTTTPDKTSTRVEREATAAFETQARRLAGETAEHRTASPEPNH